MGKDKLLSLGDLATRLEQSQGSIDINQHRARVEALQQTAELFAQIAPKLVEDLFKLAEKLTSEVGPELKSTIDKIFVEEPTNKKLLAISREGLLFGIPTEWAKLDAIVEGAGDHAGIAALVVKAHEQGLEQVWDKTNSAIREALTEALKNRLFEQIQPEPYIRLLLPYAETVLMDAIDGDLVQETYNLQTSFSDIARSMDGLLRQTDQHLAEALRGERVKQATNTVEQAIQDLKIDVEAAQTDSDFRQQLLFARQRAHILNEQLRNLHSETNPLPDGLNTLVESVLQKLDTTLDSIEEYAKQRTAFNAALNQVSELGQLKNAVTAHADYLKQHASAKNERQKKGGSDLQTDTTAAIESFAPEKINSTIDSILRAILADGANWLMNQSLNPALLDRSNAIFPSGFRSVLSECARKQVALAADQLAAGCSQGNFKHVGELLNHLENASPTFEFPKNGDGNQQTKLGDVVRVLRIVERSPLVVMQDGLIKGALIKRLIQQFGLPYSQQPKAVQEIIDAACGQIESSSQLALNAEKLKSEQNLNEFLSLLEKLSDRYQITVPGTNIHITAYSIARTVDTVLADPKLQRREGFKLGPFKLFSRTITPALIKDSLITRGLPESFEHIDKLAQMISDKINSTQ